MILTPDKLWTRAEVLSKPCPVPQEGGVYGWYFDAVPPGILAANHHTVGKASLLYVGIAPKAPPKNGAKPSKQTMRERIRYHYQGNAEGSTLRLTLGCLLSEKLDIELRRVGSGKRMTFAKGEAVLSQWMADNAFVCWQQDDAPWLRERELIEELPLPLNLDGNKSNPFAATVSGLRRSAREVARQLPVVPNK
jgi:hypothetical protein